MSNRTLIGGIALAVAIVGALVIGTKSKEVLRPASNAEYAKTSVMITALDKHSGGSGVIIKSLAGVSYVLTNKHVCNLVQVGGLVRSADKDYLVAAYKVYTKHDLCMIQVNANLHVTTALAEKAPSNYDSMVIAGHPALLPTIITRGHFSDRMPIQLMIGVKPCTGAEQGDEALMCMFLGGKPLIQTFDAQPVSALIMPGSSGSGVFNSNGELSGLVFAGSQGLSYGFIVPYSAVRDFMSNLNDYKVQTPDANMKPRNLFESVFRFEDMCKSRGTRMAVICKTIKTPGIFRN